LCVVAQAYTPSYLGGRDWEDNKTSLGKKFVRSHLKQ
jgi:hypothetical protein